MAYNPTLERLFFGNLVKGALSVPLKGEVSNCENLSANPRGYWLTGLDYNA